MSDFSLTLVLHFKTSKNFNGMAKVQIKSEKITPFGGIFFVLDKFDSILSSVIDSHLGLRSTLIGYQYSEMHSFSAYNRCRQDTQYCFLRSRMWSMVSIGVLLCPLIPQNFDLN